MEQRTFCKREYCYVGDIGEMMSTGNPLSNQRSHEVLCKKVKKTGHVSSLRSGVHLLNVTRFRLVQDPPDENRRENPPLVPTGFSNNSLLFHVCTLI